MTTHTELRDLLAAENSATPRPWGVATVEGQAFAVHYGEHDTVALYLSHPDARLIAAAVNALPGLLDRARECDRLEAVAAVRTAHRDRLRDVLLPEARERAERAEVKLAAITGLCDDLTEEIEQRRADAPSFGPDDRREWVTFTAALSDARDRLRSLLDTHTPIPGHCTCGQPGCSDGGA